MGSWSCAKRELVEDAARADERRSAKRRGARPSATCCAGGPAQDAQGANRHPDEKRGSAALRELKVASFPELSTDAHRDPCRTPRADVAASGNRSGHHQQPRRGQCATTGRRSCRICTAVAAAAVGGVAAWRRKASWSASPRGARQVVSYPHDVDPVRQALHGRRRRARRRHRPPRALRVRSFDWRARHRAAGCGRRGAEAHAAGGVVAILRAEATTPRTRRRVGTRRSSPCRFTSTTASARPRAMGRLPDSRRAAARERADCRRPRLRARQTGRTALVAVFDPGGGPSTSRSCRSREGRLQVLDRRRHAPGGDDFDRRPMTLLAERRRNAADHPPRPRDPAA